MEITGDAKLIVRAPKKAPMEFIEKFILDKTRWIQEHLNKARLKLQAVELIKKQRPQTSQNLIKDQKKNAKDLLHSRVIYFSNKFGLQYNKVKINNAKKRWGSCTSKGNLNFCWRLAMAPLMVIDYVVVHELSHLEHKDHSKRFWKKVEDILPNYKEQRKWLKDNGHLLVC